MKSYTVSNHEQAQNPVEDILNTNWEKNTLWVCIYNNPSAETIRTLKQNRLMWMWFDKIREHLAASRGQFLTSEQLKETFQKLLLPTEVIVLPGMDPVSVPKGTSKLTVGEFVYFLNDIEMYCNEELELQLPLPSDLIGALAPPEWLETSE